MSSEEHTRATRILLLSHARTASHLLERMLSKQPSLIYTSHPFVAARSFQIKLLEEGPLAQASQKAKDDLFKCWQDAFPTWETFFANAVKEGKTGFLHCHPHFMIQPGIISEYVHGDDAAAEKAWVVQPTQGSGAHSPDNPMVLPDAALLAPGTIPIFTIRHPALMVPSIYRTLFEAVELGQSSRESLVFSSSLRWQRLLYDWYVQHGKAGGITPLIVDADDYQGPNREAFLARLCAATGLEADHVIYSWNKSSEEELKAMPPPVTVILKTILGSNGVIEGLDATSLDLDAEQRKWSERFGDEGAKHIKELVERTMGDYEYLRARKLFQ